MSGQPKVCHLITRLLNGGAEGETLKLVEGMDGYSVVLGHGREALDSRVAEFEAAGAWTRQFPLIRHYNPITAPAAVLSVARFLRRNEVDILHTHSTEAGIVGRFAARLMPGPAVVHTVHGVPFSENRSAMLNRFVLACERVAARCSDRIFTNTDRIRDAYLKRGIGVPGQYHTIPSGVDVDRFADAAPASDVDSDGIRVVMVARLAQGKGHNVLLDAAAALRDEVHVYVVGKGPLEGRLRRRINERNLEDNVTLLGFRRDVPSILAAADVLVLPSYREGMPRVVTEAMAAGRPVVATAVAGVPDQVVDGETGYLIPTGDSDALRDRIRELAARPSRRERMGEAGRRRARDRFSAAEMVERTEAVYESLLD
jgi:glycosyltransferase involved in cell wall biosynthesis